MSSIWAVAKNTITQALRLKVAVVVIVLLLILLPLMGVVMGGDGTLKGKLQTFISYGLSLTSIMLCLMTIVISTFTLSDDIKRRHIFLIATKPIARHKILLGKFLGVMILNTILLTVFASIIWGLTLYIPRIAKASPEEIALVNRQFYIARQSLEVTVDYTQFIKVAEAKYERLQREGGLAKDVSKNTAIREYAIEAAKASESVAPGANKIWEFEDIRLKEGTQSLFVQYKFNATSTGPDDMVYAIWQVGDLRQENQAEPGKWKTNIHTLKGYVKDRTFTEFEAPAIVVAEDGHLSLRFINIFENGSMITPQDVKVLYKAGSFNGNFLRANFVILSRLTFLAALGISLTTWLSFPVAILICMVVFVVGTVNGFVFESLEALSTQAQILYMFTIKPILWLFPQFDGEANPSSYLVSANLLSWLQVAKIFVVTAILKPILLLGVSMLIFARRELAKVTA
jgi:hypothetical protein